MYACSLVADVNVCMAYAPAPVSTAPVNMSRAQRNNNRRRPDGWSDCGSTATAPTTASGLAIGDRVDVRVRRLPVPMRTWLAGVGKEGIGLTRSGQVIEVFIAVKRVEGSGPGFENSRTARRISVCVHRRNTRRADESFKQLEAGLTCCQTVKQVLVLQESQPGARFRPLHPTVFLRPRDILERR